MEGMRTLNLIYSLCLDGPSRDKLCMEWECQFPYPAIFHASQMHWASPASLQTKTMNFT